MPSHPTLVFIRHGQTDWNVELRLQGQQDIPLNDHGRAQARRNGQMAAQLIPDIATFDFVASPLERTRETMEIARAAMGFDPKAYRTDDRLREITFGDWEGFTTEELRKTHPEMVAEREKDKWSFLPPGGESYRMLSDRAASWLNTVKRNTVAVSHGGIGRVLIGLITGLAPAETVALDFHQDRFLLWRDESVTWI
jgi:probable phosphoglycerate mutase